MTLFEYFQLATVVVILCVIVTKAIYLRVATGINPIVIWRGQGAWRVVEMLAFASVVLWLVEVVLHALHSRYDIFPDLLGFSFLNSTVVKVLGLLFVCLGLIILLLAFVSFGNSWRIGIDRQTPGTLVTKGIFRITRNPIFVAFNFFSIGIFLMNGTEFFLIFALLAALAIHFQIRREEAFLSRQYGQAFQDYCRRVPRYLVW